MIVDLQVHVQCLSYQQVTKKNADQPQGQGARRQPTATVTSASAASADAGEVSISEERLEELQKSQEAIDKVRRALDMDTVRYWKI